MGTSSEPWSSWDERLEEPPTAEMVVCLRPLYVQEGSSLVDVCYTNEQLVH